MPIAGTDLGKVWQGQEGMGIAEKVDTSQSDGMKQYGFKLKLADLKERQADNKATQANIYKRTQKPEWWSIHDSELSQTHSDLMNETARLMRTKGVQDPFALSADPDVIAVQKKWNDLDTMAKTSKDLREYSQKMQDAEFRKTVDEDSFNQFNEWFGKNKISDIVKNGSQPPSIRKKNPIEDFGTYWMPFIKQNGGFEDKDGNELSREALSNIVAMKYASPNPDLAAFDQKMLTGLDPKITAALEAEQKKQALQGNQKSLGQIYAENQLWRLAQSQVAPADTEGYSKKVADGIQDITSQSDAGGVHKVTTVNYGQDREKIKQIAQETATLDLQNNPKLFRTYSKRYGTTDMNQLVSKVTNEIMAKKDQQFKVDNTKPTNVNIKVGDGEKGTEGNDQWLGDLFSGDIEANQQARNALLGKNTSLGGVIDRVDVVQRDNAWGIDISYTSDDPDANGKRTQKSKFIKGSAEDSGLLLDLIQGAKQGQKKNYKRIVTPKPLLERIVPQSATQQTVTPQNNGKKSAY